jgi:hypothetical protein
VHVRTEYAEDHPKHGEIETYMDGKYLRTEYAEGHPKRGQWNAALSIDNLPFMLSKMSLKQRSRFEKTGVLNGSESGDESDEHEGRAPTGSAQEVSVGEEHCCPWRMLTLVCSLARVTGGRFYGAHGRGVRAGLIDGECGCRHELAGS